MATIDELKQRTNLHDLAAWLGLKQGKNEKANYHSPHREDKNPSLSLYQRNGIWHWKDHAANQGGTCVDLVIYVRSCDVAEAVKLLHEFLNIPIEKPKQEARPQRSLVEWIAERCSSSADRAIDYLKGRAIAESVIKRAIKNKSIGFNDWVSDKVPANEPMHGGPAVAFIVRSLNPGHVAAVDMRYLDPALNGGVKTSCQGEKHGFGWTSNVRWLMDAKTVYIVESPINALSIESASLSSTAAIATRGIGNVGNIDWRFLQGKRVVICMDNDEPFPEGHPQAGHCPGQEAGWQLHEILTGFDVAAQMVDQEDWKVNDVNDLLKEKGADELTRHLRKIEPWLIPGLSGTDVDKRGRSRVYLPYHDKTAYERYRVKEDFISYFTEKVTKDDAGVEHRTPLYADLSGFRVASISRVTIASAVSTMTGDQDTQPRVMFAVSVQTPRHGAKLLRRVVDDEKLHNIDQWKRFGPVFNQSNFLRMVNILERTAHIGARKAANFVGLAWRDGRLIVNEGPNCYFTNPEQQCPYHNLIFPAGTLHDGRAVIQAYQSTFKRNAASLALVWALGAHLKAFLGFWPHIQMQAAKGSGKSTLTKRIERSIGMTMFSGQSLNTEFRLLTSISHTSHPVGWEELSARRVEIIDKAVSLLQECYQYSVNRRGSDMTEFLLVAPVMLAGEDVPVRSLIGKLIRTELTGKKGPEMTDDLPKFPMRQWLEWLSTLTRAHVMGLHREMRNLCVDACSATGEDDGAVRMVGNYAAVRAAWRLLCEFLQISYDQDGFELDLIAEMNSHITGTSSDRQPWVWIVETLLSEIARGEFKYPYKWDTINDRQCLLVRTAHVMDHLAHTNALREKWNSLPIKSDRVFKRELISNDVLLLDGSGAPLEAERTFGDPMHGKRVPHMVALDLAKLEQFGLYGTPTSLG